MKHTKKSEIKTLPQRFSLSLVTLSCLAVIASLGLALFTAISVLPKTQPVAQAEEIAKTSPLKPYEGLTKLDTSKKNILFFNADWCGFCKANLAEMKKLSNTISKDVVLYDLDIDDKANAQLVKQYSVKVYPTYVQIDPQGKQLLRSEGGDSFSAVLKKLGY